MICSEAELAKIQPAQRRALRRALRRLERLLGPLLPFASKDEIRDQIEAIRATMTEDEIEMQRKGAQELLIAIDKGKLKEIRVQSTMRFGLTMRVGKL